MFLESQKFRVCFIHTSFINYSDDKKKLILFLKPVFLPQATVNIIYALNLESERNVSEEVFNNIHDAVAPPSMFEE